MSHESNGHVKGISMVITGAALWGVSGTVAQQLFQHEGVLVSWLVTVRLLLSGILLLTFSLFGKDPKKMWRIWTIPKQVGQLVVFGILGLLGVQYTYFASVHLGNAAVATLLQYLAPLFVLVYFIWQTRQKPGRIDILSVVLALAGTYLLLTNASGGHLHLASSAIIWGILSGVALAFYTIYPDALLKTWGSPVVIGWGMVIGGLALSILHPPWKPGHVHWSAHTLLFIGFVVFFGTLLAFYLYLESLRYLSAKESSLLACVEPLTAVITAVLWLGVTMKLYQSIGAALVIGMILLLALKPKPKIHQMENVNESM